MKARIALTMALVFVSGCAALFAAPRPAGATHYTSVCKWTHDPPPRTINYFIHEGSDLSYQFTSDGATRVRYGADTWNGTNSNLILQRVYSLSQANNSGPFNPSTEIYKVNRPNDDFIAQVELTKNGGCALDTGDPILYAKMQWNTGRYIFYGDCLAAPGYCEQVNARDVENVAAHEFGHFFYLYNIYGVGNTERTMYGFIDEAETKKRTLEIHDTDGAQIMYGTR